MNNLKRNRCNTLDFGLVQEAEKFLTTQNFYNSKPSCIHIKNCLSINGLKFIKCADRMISRF